MENCSNCDSMCINFKISAGFLEIALLVWTFSHVAFHMLIGTLSGHLGPGSRKSRNFSGAFLCIFKTKASRGTKLFIPFTTYEKTSFTE